MPIAFDFITLPGQPNALTLPNGINDFAVVIGSNETEKPTASTGFLYVEGNTYTFGVPPALNQTAATALNNLGSAVGTTAAGPWVFTNGRFQSLIVPGVAEPLPTGINDFGVIVGSGAQLVGAPPGPAWLYKNGHATTINVPGSLSTNPQAINDFGQVVGWYRSATSQVLAYEETRGAFSTLDLPASAVATGINNLGEIVGWQDPFPNGSGPQGFLYIDGRFTTVNVPGATATMITGVNDLGQIVGTYQLPPGLQFAFVATPRS